MQKKVEGLLYMQIADFLRDKIYSKEWRAGYRIPSENELRQEFGVSRGTVRKALNALVTEGMLEQVKGKGTFVYEPHISHVGGDRPLSFAESLRMQHDDHTPAGDTFLQADLSEGLDKIFPEQNDWKTYRYPGLQHYEAVESWPNAEAYLPGGDRRALWNGDAHLRSTLIGGNQTFEVEDGKLQLNGLASIYFVDFDRTRERTRARHLADLVAEIKSDGTSEEDTNVGSEGGNSQAEDGGNAEGDNQAEGGNQAESGSNAEGGNA